MLKAVGQVLFSSGLQTPKFTAEKSKGQDYEVRTYHATNWVSTTIEGMQQDVKVEMTAPVSCLVNPGAGPACETSFTVSFFIPEEHQADPPRPTDLENIFVENRKQFTAYVRTYGGFSNEQKSREELLRLVESLQRDGAPYKETPYYIAGYDSPFKLTNRTNEVWILKKEDGE
ncbi:heme-binding protein 2 isoform X2 [Osmerus mordax]|uniref:heme-binding protein 2 isoform X2 n=1 Tax=Osmerus mordax TaxID=8014 RepID=UPI0035107158